MTNRQIKEIIHKIRPVIQKQHKDALAGRRNVDEAGVHIAKVWIDHRG